jgi:hypothetical protein
MCFSFFVNALRHSDARHWLEEEKKSIFFLYISQQFQSQCHQTDSLYIKQCDSYIVLLTASWHSFLFRSFDILQQAGHAAKKYSIWCPSKWDSLQYFQFSCRFWYSTSIFINFTRLVLLLYTTGRVQYPAWTWKHYIFGSARMITVRKE